MNTLLILMPWVNAIAVFFIFLLIFAGCRHFFLWLIKLVNQKMPLEINNDIIAAIDSPLHAAVFIIGLVIAICVSPLKDILTTLPVQRIIRSALLICIFWGAFNLTTATNKLFTYLLNKLGGRISDSIADILSTFVHTIILCLGGAIILSEWGFDISGFIAGLSLGGLALSLAAKDLFADIFGGIVIITDKPFAVGDWILCNGIEGVVEKITFRSTLVRTFPQALVYIPNATIANTTISNFSTRDKRRIDFTVGVTYTTTRAQMRQLVQRIDNALLNIEALDKDTIVVSFSAMNSSSLDIRIVCYSQFLDYASYARQLETINLEIMRILEETGTSAAFPSTSIYMETPIKYESADKKN